MNARSTMDSPKFAPVRLHGGPLSASEVEDVALRWRAVTLEPTAVTNLEQGRRIVDAALGDGGSHYGINTGFGSLSRTRVASEDLRALQRNLVRSHSAGVGEPLTIGTVRAMMLLLAASLCRGKSGVRTVVAQTIIDMLNHRLTPVVPSIGSVGASGDLAPLAHVALALIGESVVTREAATTQEPSVVAMRSCGIDPLQLEAKEGLALINGTHLMAAEGALLICEMQRLFAAAIVSCAMSIDACRGTDAHLDDRVYIARNQPGPAQLALRLRESLAGSQIIQSHVENDPRVQDPYSLRCAATVLGAARDAASYVKRAITAELGAVTDNPLVFDGDDSRSIVSAGNFHGMPLAIPLDTLCIAIAHIAGISERRTFLMLAATDPEAQLSPYLTPRPGLNSGLMIAQYTAAACCNEIIGLSMPASVANVSTSAGMEDYNSFGPRSAAKARRAMELARTVIAVELLCAAQGIEMHRPLKSGAIVERAIETVRGAAPPLSDDRPIAPDMERVSALIREGAFGSETL